MTAYAAVSVYSIYHCQVYQATKGNKWALVYFGVFSGRHPDINYISTTSNIILVLLMGCTPRFALRKGMFGLDGNHSYSPHAKPI
jgi:hypothetical protein